MEDDKIIQLWKIIIIRVFLGIALLCLISLPETIFSFKVKMKALDVANKAVEKGLELRLNGDLLKGIDLVKIEQKTEDKK
jgi:hypothetical protein